MNIVYLGWGSLIWDYKYLLLDLNPAIKVWRKSELKLPIEFSRISDKGKGRLTLVIDEKNGTLNNMWYANSRSNNLNDVIKNLKKREKTSASNIGYVNLKKNMERAKNIPKKYLKQIKTWAKKHGIDAVVWTDLKSNWVKIRKKPFSNSDALKYFNKAKPDTKNDILTYIYRAIREADINTKFSKYFFNQILQ